MLAHRKQGLVLPTLVLMIAPDPTTEKLRKRRSSRAATLVSGKEAGPTTLWFRTEGEAYRLHEWARCIQAAAQTSAPEPQLPMSPISPSSPSLASPSFNSPFRHTRETVNFSLNRPPSAPKPTLHHKGSTATAATFSSRERPLTFSDTPSLRSRRSDLSSLRSSNPPTINTTHNFGVAIPGDLPSPAMTTAGEHSGGYADGWASVQGRSSSLSSPSRNARDSMGSVAPFSPAPLLESGSPPFARETILDRAFQLKCIPGSEQQVPGGEKLSSLARFEALMQQVDEQQRKRNELKARPPGTGLQYELKSAWDVDQDSDGETFDADSDDTEEDSPVERDHPSDGEMNSIRPGSRRAFEARRGGPQTPSQSPRSRAGPRSPIPAHSETLSALNSGSTLGRNAGQRSHQHTLSGLANMCLSVERPSCDGSPGKSSIVSGATSVHEETGGLNPSAAYRTSTISEGQQQQQRNSSSSSSHGGKRLSFTEFTRRLSSTSSMLLVQSNAEHADAPAPSRRSSTQPRGPASALSSPKTDAQPERERGDKCKNWRNNVGMFGPDGTFL